jgi:uncharacterized protein (AIM24 family)
MTLAHRVLGTTAQAVAVQLDPGQALWCPSRRVVWTTPTITVQARAGRPVADDAGLLNRAVHAGRRLVGGGSLSVRWVQATGASGVVTLAPPVAGEVQVLELTGGAGWWVVPDGVVAAESTVTSAPGREGLERLAGTGTVILGGDGALLETDPGRHGGRLLVAADRLVGHEATVVATDDGGGVLALTGPGRVLLQAVPRQGTDETGRGTGRSSAPNEGISMDFITRAREAAERAATLAQQGLAQGQDRIEDLQSQRRGTDVLRNLGAAYYAEQREGGEHEAVVRALAAVDAHVAAHGPVTPPRGQTPPPPPTNGGPGPTPPSGSTLDDL